MYARLNSVVCKVNASADDTGDVDPWQFSHDPWSMHDDSAEYNRRTNRSVVTQEAVASSPDIGDSCDVHTPVAVAQNTSENAANVERAMEVASKAKFKKARLTTPPPLCTTQVLVDL